MRLRVHPQRLLLVGHHRRPVDVDDTVVAVVVLNKVRQYVVFVQYLALLFGEACVQFGRIRG